MKISTPLLQHVLEIREGRITSLVIENGQLFRNLVKGMHESAAHDEDTLTLSQNGITIKASDTLEIIQTFIPFSLNSRVLVSALTKKLEKLALASDWRDRTMEVIEKMTLYVKRLTMEIPHEIECEGLTIGAILNASRLTFSEDDTTDLDLLVDYMRLIREFVGERLYVLVNARTYFTDMEMEGMLNVCNLEKIPVLLIDGVERPLLPNEDRLLVDKDLCELTRYDDIMV